MLKFLRKYQTWIMAVGGSLLMVAFLMPSALQQIGKVSPASIQASVVINGKTVKIKQEGWDRARNELNILVSGFPSMIENLLDPYQLPEDDPNKVQIAGPAHWYLLTLEARLAGFTSGTLEGEYAIRAEAEHLAANIPDLLGDTEKAYELIMARPLQAAAQGRLREPDVHRAYSSFLAVQRLIETYRTADVAADWRFRNMVDQFEHKVGIDMLFLDAEDFIADIADPTEEELATHFEQYKAAEPDTGEYGIGYFRPDRVQIEYLTIDYGQLLKETSVTGKDARKWYYKNKNNPNIIPRAAGSTEAPDYDDVAGDVLSAYRRVKAEEKLTEITRHIKSILFRSVQGLPRDGDYRTLPDDWNAQRTSFEALREEVQQQFGVDVSYNHIADRWLTFEDLATLDGIGRGRRMMGTQSIGVRQLADSLKEFDHITFPGLQLGLADAEPLRAMSNERLFGRSNPVPTDTYFYRITAVDPQGSARSLDEVRDSAVRNIKRIKAYERFVRETDTWTIHAASLGLDGVIDSDERITARTRVTRHSSIAQYDRWSAFRSSVWETTRIGVAGRSQELADALFDKVKDWDPLQRVTDLDPAQRVVVVPVAEELGLAITLITNNDPLTKEKWISAVDSPSYWALYSRVEYGDSPLEAFGIESMQTRYNLTFKKSKVAETDGEATPAGMSEESEDEKKENEDGKEETGI